MSVYRMDISQWSVERVMYVFGGSLTVVFALLSIFVHQYFSWGAVFVGAMFVIFAVTGYCPGAIIAAKIMKK